MAPCTTPSSQRAGHRLNLGVALAIGCCCLVPPQAPDGAYARDELPKSPAIYVNVLQGTRPAYFFRLVHAAQPAVCNQYAASIAPLAVSRSSAPFSALTRSTREIKRTDIDSNIDSSIRHQLGAYGALLSFSAVDFDNTGQPAWIVVATGKAAHAVFLPDETARTMTSGKIPLAQTLDKGPTFVKDRYTLWRGSRQLFEAIQRITNGSPSDNNWGHHNFISVQNKMYVSFVFFPYAASNVPLILAEILPDRSARMVCAFMTRFKILP